MEPAADLPASPTPSPPRRGPRPGDLAAAVALVVSVASLWVAWRQGELMERQLAASVWPSLAYVTGNLSDDGRPVIALGLRNGGIGPARVRAFEVSVGGQPVRRTGELIDAACGPGRPATPTTTSPVLGILAAGQEVAFLKLDKAAVPEAIWACFDRARFTVEGRACFCSALDDCWSVGFHDREPVRVQDCREAAARPQYEE